MYLEIVTPEAVLLSAEVDSVSVPGVEGQFQMLNNHAPIVSVLTKGEIKVFTHSHPVKSDDLSKDFKRDAADSKILILQVDGGVVEMKDNKVIVLAD
ncbi:FoF1 ATP synthase subunit delta/epsilon [Salinimicrobium xinjiangense]|uniref:FoF1 ATP synthase subunit delta/epsilon n=1 Tax=Salinimicrobium xinjiangense TaxID=438596 RepID=UPI00040DF751|nr:F0F1 ATP synthase subunit epsilon [Salinimicrobium xinjiangense]